MGDNMITIAIVGAAGRMGGALIRGSRNGEGLKVVAALEQKGHAALGRDAGAVAGIDAIGVAITDNPKALEPADVLIDFSFHSAVPDNLSRAVRLGKPVVLGTTGLTDAETAAVKAAAGRIPILWAPNMSLGVNLLFAMVEKAAGVLGLEYDAEIVEVHHRHKRDAPSGTALRLGEKIAAGRGQDFKAVARSGRDGLVGERPRGEIGLHAVRSGDVIGDHTVSFATDGERIEFAHRASSRDAFAAGALKAALWLPGRAPGLYDMKDVLGL